MDFLKKFKHEIIIFIIIIFVFCFWLYVFESPADTKFECSKLKNICTSTSTNGLNLKTTKTIPLNKILYTTIEDNVGTKISYERYSWQDICYYYNWVIFYKEKKDNKTIIFKSSEYDFPVDKYNDEQYLYYTNIMQMFESYLKDNSENHFYARAYTSFKTNIIYLGQILLLTFICVAIIIYSFIIFSFFIQPAIESVYKFFKKNK